MFSAIFDVALGLISLFLVLSIMASAVNEAISSYLNRRAKTLEDFITNLLKGTKITLASFYGETLIAAQTKDGQHPAYLQAADFSQALTDSIRKHYLLPEMPAATTATAQVQQMTAMTTDLTVDEWKNVIANLPQNTPLRNMMAAMLNKMLANPAIKLHDQIESWFNSSMDRVSGFYKQRTQAYLLAIGLILAFGLNIDTIEVTNSLLRSPAVRSAASSVASQLNQNGGSTASPSNSTLDQLLNQLDVPIGWPDPNMPTIPDISWLIKKLAGLIITAFAISQGAPFWFDVLNKVTNLRSSGKPPPELPPPPPPQPPPPAVPPASTPPSAPTNLSPTGVG